MIDFKTKHISTGEAGTAIRVRSDQSDQKQAVLCKKCFRRRWMATAVRCISNANRDLLIISGENENGLHHRHALQRWCYEFRCSVETIEFARSIVTLAGGFLTVIAA